jgi:hypothetical protein
VFVSIDGAEKLLGQKFIPIRNLGKFYANFKTIKAPNMAFLLTGIFGGQRVDYVQIYGIKEHSIAMIDNDKYDMGFTYIYLGQDFRSKKKRYRLEWDDFNKKFKGFYDDPRQALEMVSPTFMEKLMELSKKYKGVSVEYFESKEYQKNCLALIIPKLVFPLKMKKGNEYMAEFNNFINDAIALKKSI